MNMTTEQYLNQYTIERAETFITKLNDNSIDMIIIDPPYGISYKYGFNKKALKASIINDLPNAVDWDLLLNESFRILKPRKSFFIFGRFDTLALMYSKIKKIFKYNHDFVWYKGDMNSGNLNVMGTTHELILHFSKGSPEKSRLMMINSISKKRVKAFYQEKLSSTEYVGHPTQKPIGLLKYLIENRTDTKDIVLDFFAGSGSCGIACSELSRDFILCDEDKTWKEVFDKRKRTSVSTCQI